MRFRDWFKATFGPSDPQACGCGHCTEDVRHASDCAVHDEPAIPDGSRDCSCDCGAEHEPLIPDHEPRKPTSTGERKARGLRARIQREEIEHALDRMVFRATRQWAETRPEDHAKREELHRLVGVIRALREELRSVEADGNMAAAEEQAEQRRKAMRPADRD